MAPALNSSVELLVEPGRAARVIELHQRCSSAAMARAAQHGGRRRMLGLSVDATNLIEIRRGNSSSFHR